MPSESGVSSPSSLNGTSGSGTGGGGDWPSYVTGKIEMVVSLIRDKTLGKLSVAVHYAIYALMALTVGLLLAVMFAVGLLRVLDDEVFHRRVWASYFVIAGIFAVVGMLCVWLRKPRK